MVVPYKGVNLQIGTVSACEKVSLYQNYIKTKKQYNLAWHDALKQIMYKLLKVITYIFNLGVMLYIYEWNTKL